MNDVQRYRMNAAECLSAAERSGPDYRGLALAIARSWLSLARQQETTGELLAIWSKARPTTLAAPSLRPFQYPARPRALEIRTKIPPPRMATVPTALLSGIAGRYVPKPA
jgi:hypothetical protein